MYKLVEIEGEARIKLSQDIAKVMIPGCKKIYRIFNKVVWADAVVGSRWGGGAVVCGGRGGKGGGGMFTTRVWWDIFDIPRHAYTSNSPATFNEST